MSMSRTDQKRFSTSITPLGNGRYGARVLLDGVVIFQDNTAHDRQEAALNLKGLLRWVDKMGYDSPMASASRLRNYCKRPKQGEKSSS